jgi:hypothetical protein
MNTNASIQGTFWSLTFGNPSNGGGDDNGVGSDSLWLVASGPDHYLSGDLGDAPYDGCIANGPNPLNNKMVVALSDVDASGASVVQVGNEAQITINSPSFTSIYYSDGSAGCVISGVIKQYDVWLKEVGRDAPAPTDRNQTTGAWILVNTCNIGSSCVVTTSCGTTVCDAYLAVSPRYDSGFQTGDAPGNARVGPNSTRVQAGLLSAGAVPDGPPGVPLTLDKGAAPLLNLSWGASCSAGAVDYEVHEGTLSSFTSHVSLLCSTGGATTAVITPSSASSYYLVLPATSSTEGSYGKNGSGVERPASTLPCRPQNLGSCP